MNTIRRHVWRGGLVATLGVTLVAGGCSSGTEPTDTAGPPVEISKAAGDGQSGVVGQELPGALVVRLRDAAGRGVPGRTITFAVTSGGGSLWVTTAATGPDGSAATRWTLGPSVAEEQRVEARIVVPETGDGLIATFAATPRADEPATLELVGGTDQLGSPARALADSLAVRVLDNFLNPVQGAQITWTVAEGDGAVSPPVSETDTEGIARTRWTLGAVEGVRQVVSAMHPGLPPVEFEAYFVQPCLFQDGFESGLTKWRGRSTGHHAEIVADPLRPQNSAVRFTRPVAAGDIFGEPVPVDPTQEYTLRFEYLGLAVAGSEPDNFGGWIGISDGIPGAHDWLAGSIGPPYVPHHLVDDGAWHTYVITFRPSALFTSLDNMIHVMIEDGEGSGAVARDAYFDNVCLSGPSPSGSP